MSAYPMAVTSGGDYAGQERACKAATPSQRPRSLCFRAAGFRDEKTRPTGSRVVWCTASGAVNRAFRHQGSMLYRYHPVGLGTAPAGSGSWWFLKSAASSWAHQCIPALSERLPRFGRRGDCRPGEVAPGGSSSRAHRAGRSASVCCSEMPFGRCRTRWSMVGGDALREAGGGSVPTVTCVLGRLCR